MKSYARTCRSAGEPPANASCASLYGAPVLEAQPATNHVFGDFVEKAIVCEGGGPQAYERVAETDAKLVSGGRRRLSGIHLQM